MNSEVAREYARRFARLRTDRSRARWSEATGNRAPHKPLLLLCILDLFEQGELQSNLIRLTPELGELFNRYWRRVLPLERRGNLALPFFHLRSEGFWRLLPRSGREAALEMVSQIRSLGRLEEIVAGARLEEPLYELLGYREARKLLRAVLVEAHFAPEVGELLLEQGAINREAFLYSRELLGWNGGRIVRETLERESAYRATVRDQGFRRAVVTAYAHRCALCGVRVRTLGGHTVVDAAHIVPWSASRDDRPSNGLALCRTCHWAFDEGLLSVSREYEVAVSGTLRALHNVPGYLGTLEESGIARPVDRAYWPDHDSLRWHRRNVFVP